MIVIGGGLSGAAKLFLPHFSDEMNKPFTTLAGERLDRMEVKAFSLLNQKEKAEFLKTSGKQIAIPRSNKTINYDVSKKIGIGISILDTSEAVALGAYAFALQKLDEKN